jgi:F1F0 ATPase subunit 2
MMNEIIYALVVFTVGCTLGTLFFGGLWLTIKKMKTTKMPSLLFLASFVFRVVVVLWGFYFVAATHWQNMLICLLGFMVARFVVTRFTKPRLTICAIKNDKS